MFEEISDHVKGYHFFQLMHLLEKNNNYPSLKLIPNRRLIFPGNDVEALIQDDQGWSMILNFMGLYGVDSPLPLYLTHQFAQEGRQEIRDFLDLFNHRIYELLYLAWRKYQPQLNLKSSSADYLHYLMALSNRIIIQKDYHHLAYCGWFGQRNRCALGLKTMLEHMLQMPITITQNYLCWRHLANNPNESKILGDNVLVGEAFLDANTQVLINLGPVSFTKLKSLLPSNSKENKLLSLIHAYIPMNLRFQLKFFLTGKTAPLWCLGGFLVQLGIDAVLGLPQDKYYFSYTNAAN